MTYTVNVANEAPETGYRPYGRPLDGLAAALTKARKLVVGSTRPETAYVEEEGTSRVWSVTHLPGPAHVVDDEIVREPGSVRVVFDGREQEVSVAEDGTVNVGELAGDLNVSEEALDAK